MITPTTPAPATDLFNDASANDSTYVVNKIQITLSLLGSYYPSAIITDLNTQLSTNTYLLPSSAMTIIDASNISAVYNQCYKLMIRLNRLYVNNNDYNLKVAVVFPSTDTSIWLGQSSCFQFIRSVNELTNIVAETPNLITTYDISSNPYMELVCNSPYNYDASGNKINNFVISVANSTGAGYSLSGYLGAIQTAMTDASENGIMKATISNDNHYSLAELTFDVVFFGDDGVDSFGPKQYYAQ